MAERATVACSCKVGRVAERHGLDTLDEELVRRRREEDASLRALADVVNRRVLSAVLAAHGVDGGTNDVFGAISGERAVEALYEALAGDDARPERRARVRTRLEQHGIDVTSVTADWVTHPTVRNHLRDCLGIDTGRGGGITVEDAVDTTEWARARCTGVVARTFERLADADLVRTGELDVSVTIRLTCETCGNTYRPNRLIEAGGCACGAGRDGSA